MQTRTFFDNQNVNIFKSVNVTSRTAILQLKTITFASSQ